MPTQDMLQFMPKNKPKVVDSVSLRRHADNRSLVNPEAHTVDLRIGQLLDNNELYSTFHQ